MKELKSRGIGISAEGGEPRKKDLEGSCRDIYESMNEHKFNGWAMTTRQGKLAYDSKPESWGLMSITICMQDSGVLGSEDHPKPEPVPGVLRIRGDAASVNSTDYKNRQAGYPEIRAGVPSLTMRSAISGAVDEARVS